MILGAPFCRLLAILLRLALLVVVSVAMVTTWGPVLDSNGIQKAEAGAVALGHAAHHGVASGETPDAPRHSGACVVVCAGAATSLRDAVPSALTRVIAIHGSPSQDTTPPGRTLDPALRPPRAEALL